MSLKVVVTGGKGFLGQHVTKKLELLGAQVLPLGRKDGDLRKADTATSLLREADRVVHLAADVGGVGYLRQQSGRVYHDNLLMGLNVVKAVCGGSASRLVVASSPCCYAASVDLPAAEASLERGVPSGDTAPYAFSKLATSAVADTLCALAGKQAVSFIPSNMYGPNDTFSTHRSHVAAALLRKALVAAERGQSTFDVWGDGSATRDFVFVEDVAAAVAAMTLSEQPLRFSVYNLGSGIEMPIRSIAQTIAECVSDKISPVFSPNKPVGYMRRVLCISRAKEKLGYSPKTNLEDGLAKTIHWIRESGKLGELLNEE